MTGILKKTTPELLLPAGDPVKLKYAVAYGADAVYLGLPMASLRTPSRGAQFTPANLQEHVHYAQSRGVKAYVTINIFPSNRDLARIQPHLELLEAIRPDAIIFSDPGVYRMAKRHAPSVPLHLSTQANTLNLEACGFWQDLGVERVILAREVPLREIAEIHEALPTLELECFVHGSLCVAYSGRCVISDYLTDNTKNSNKGMCGNSCRWEFEEANELKSISMREVSRPHEEYTFEEDQHGSYMLNSKDLCLVHQLHKLQEAGVVSFKVEGRTKSIYYVATAGRIYREAIDFIQNHPEGPSEVQATRWVRELSMAGNRGFTEGFFNGRPDNKSINYETSKTQQSSIFLATVSEEASWGEGQITVQARNPFQVGDEVEWVTPNGLETLTLTSENLKDHLGLPVTAVQTNHLAQLPLPKDVTKAEMPWLILRRKEKHPVVC